MGRTSTIDKLPVDVINELRRRLVSSNFTRYEEHAAWLAELGHPGSRSAIHRYGLALEEELRSDSELRLRCLEVASRLPNSDGKEGLLVAAEYLVEWVRTGRR